MTPAADNVQSLIEQARAELRSAESARDKANAAAARAEHRIKLLEAATLTWTRDTTLLGGGTHISLFLPDMLKHELEPEAIVKAVHDIFVEAVAKNVRAPVMPRLE